MISREDILLAQKTWGDAIVEIGRLKEKREVCEKVTLEILERLYALDRGIILFKPTKAAVVPFRTCKSSVKSYFIGGDDQYEEDDGFALQPWTGVRFENEGIILEENRAIVMGHYYFINSNGEEMKVEFTMGYFKDASGMLKIDLHHSSIPFCRKNQ